MRGVHVTAAGAISHVSQMAILYLHGFYITRTIADSLERDPKGAYLLEGTLNVTNNAHQTTLGPASLGYLYLPRDRPTVGARWKTGGEEYVVIEASGSQVGLRTSDALRSFHVNKSCALPSNYQALGARGVSFPVSSPACPSGIGRAHICDSIAGTARSVSMKEIRRLQGGRARDYPKASPDPEKVDRISPGTQPAVQLYLVGIAIGAYFVLCPHVDSPQVVSYPVSPRFWGCRNRCLGMPATRRPLPRPGQRRHRRRRQQTNMGTPSNVRNDGRTQNGRAPLMGELPNESAPPKGNHIENADKSAMAPTQEGRGPSPNQLE